MENLEYTKDFKYRHDQKDMEAFANWLGAFTRSEKFIEISKKFLDFQVLLYNEKDKEVRSQILAQERKLIKEVIM